MIIIMEVKLIALTNYFGDYDCYPDNPNPTEALIEHAGRVCYRSTGESAKFIEKRIAAGHESIIEHASATFEISGISRACSHQLVRHRIASYSQESQRYVDMEMFHAIIPQSVADSQEAKDIWYDVILAIRDAYNRLRSLDIPKEDARFLLPNATATRLVMTMNFRELRHFFSVRLQPAAQWETRGVAAEMLRTMLEEAPAVFGDLEEMICDMPIS